MASILQPLDTLGPLRDPGATESLCPVCLALIPAQREIRGAQVYLVKDCPDHGRFESLVWDGPPAFSTWSRPRIPARPQIRSRPSGLGCPFDCGLCPEHRQKSCTVLIEVTDRCNLGCPVCFADSGRSKDPDPPLKNLIEWCVQIKEMSGNPGLQISGGEPTMRQDLPDLIQAARDIGFSFIQLNTNGLNLANDPGLALSLKNAGLSTVFLQFDGLDDQINLALRGRPLTREKLQAIDRCADAALGIVLVPTLVPGVNTGHIGTIIDLALTKTPWVRAVHFQPISYFGRFEGRPGPGDRLTLPELIRAVGSQTRGRFSAAHLGPPGCENPFCSFHGHFLLQPEGPARPLSRPASEACCGPPETPEQGADRAMDYVSRQWTAPPISGDRPPGPVPGPADPVDLDAFLDRAKAQTFSISAMVFQDVWNLDLERVRDCCIHVFDPERGLVPFCLYNLTAANGKALYRK